MSKLPKYAPGKMWRMIREAIGLSAADRLYQARAGTRIYVPCGGHRPMWGNLHHDIGAEAVAKLATLHTGYLYLPRDEAGRRAERNRKIRLFAAAGATVGVLGLMFGMHPDTISRILKESP